MTIVLKREAKSFKTSCWHSPLIQVKSVISSNELS
jgi:hypothetical protein